MLDAETKEYLARVGIRKITELDTALIETFGQNEGERHIERLTELFDLSEERLVHGTENTPYLHRQQELVDYLNQSQQMSLLASSFYDRVFFRRVMDYLLRYASFFGGDIYDIGCGNGILTCFLALRYPDSVVTGLELSLNAVAVAKELADRLQINNVHFTNQRVPGQKQCDTLFSCRTMHENAAWKALCEEPKPAALPMEEHAKRHGAYAKELAALIKDRGYLVSVERYEEDSTYAGLICALERAGLSQVRGTHMQFSCKDGDKTAVFQAMIFQKT
ncbi:MAG: class I SAM-dependent methyltransferase [Lachnospiraceae bacterium]|nr:class I SAM-dependent methyltransferase [Lachnospiraceae bacterium]